MQLLNGRQINAQYGAAGSHDDLLSRVASLQIQGEAQTVASYTYAGAVRNVNVSYPEPGVDLSYIQSSGQSVGDAGDRYTGYDRFGRTVDMPWVKASSSTVLDQFQWGYDRASNRKWKENLVASSDQDEHYNYDSLYQVKEFDRGNLNINRTAIGGIPSAEEDFSYDPTGNWKQYKNVADGTVKLDQTRKHNKDNQLTQIDGSSNGITYYRAGNATLISPDASGDWSKSYTLTWDAWNRLVKVEDGAALVADYAYDGTFRRTTKTVGGTTRHYYYNDEWKTIEERIGTSTNAERQYVWGNRHRDDLVLRDRDTVGDGTLNERLYVTHDHFNPTAILDTSGNVQERYGFTAFGARRIMAGDFTAKTSSSFDWDFGFHGQFVDTETGYYNYGYRYYVPSLGTWINRDPIEERGGVNLYEFTSNNPTNHIDHLGLTIKYLGTKYKTQREIHDDVPGTRALTWDPKTENRPKPNIEGHPKFIAKWEAGKCCVKIVKAPSLVVRLQVVLPKDWGKPLQDSFGYWNGVDKSGYKAIVDHEFRRRKVYYDADTVFLNPAEGEGKQATKCGWFCEDIFSGKSPLDAAQRYLRALQKEAIDKFDAWTEKQQLKIGEENHKTYFATRKFTHKGKIITESVEITKGLKNIHKWKTPTIKWETTCNR